MKNVKTESVNSGMEILPRMRVMQASKHTQKGWLHVVYEQSGGAAGNPTTVEKNEKGAQRHKLLLKGNEQHKKLDRCWKLEKSRKWSLLRKCENSSRCMTTCSETI